jgi:peptidoglycan hydrolase-like protein with peptidoglycan-binding domain
MQVALNRIAQSYPAIPKIPAADGVFGPMTEATVKAFQQVFELTPDGIVGQATWYAIVRLYTAVTRLAELHSYGQRFYSVSWNPPDSLRPGSTGDKVRQLQYMLEVLSNYIPEIPPVAIDGIYGSATRAAVLASQRRFRLPETGTVDATLWNHIYDQYAGIETTALRNEIVFPKNETAGTRQRYSKTSTLTQFPGRDLGIGSQDPVKQEVIR